MDFFSWLGDSISSGVDWLFSKEGFDAAADAYKLYSSSSKGTASGRTGSLMSAARTAAEYGSSSGTFRAQETRPAQVYGRDRNIFQNRAETDPWMGMFRRMLNQTDGSV